MLTSIAAATAITACGDDDSNAGTRGKDAGTDTSTTTPEAGGDETGTVNGSATYAGTKTGYFEVVLFPTTDPSKFTVPAGLVQVQNPAWPNVTFQVKDVAPGKYYAYCKINVGPDHIGPGPDDPTCAGAYRGPAGWEFPPPEVTVVAGQAATLSATLVARDPAPKDAGTDAPTDAPDDG